MTSENKISIQTNLSFRDILDAYRLYRAAATKEKDSHTIIGILLLLFGGVYIGFWLTQVFVAAPDISDLPAISGFMIVFGVVSILDLLPIAFSWISFRQHVQRYPKPVQITFEDSGIRLDSQNSYSVFEWNFFQDAFEGRTVFILVYGKASYSTIPKSTFPTEKAVDDFRNILKDHLKGFRRELRF